MPAGGGVKPWSDPFAPLTDEQRIEAMARAMATADGYDPRDYDTEAWELGWRCENPNACQLASSTDYRNLARRQLAGIKALRRLGELAA